MPTGTYLIEQAVLQLLAERRYRRLEPHTAVATTKED
jgi:hypothetical protein